MSDIVCQKTYSAMGGEFQFSCFPQNFLTKEDVLRIYDEGHAEVKRIEAKFTDFHDGDFNRINQNAGIAPVLVDDETLMLIKESLKISAHSRGTFDISFASIGHLWRAKKAINEVLDAQTIKTQLPFINYKLIEINEEDKSVFLPHSQMKIGLGGIGKGYAVDRVYELFLKRGLYNFYINGAGDVRVHARCDAPRKWRIGIRNPLSPDIGKSVGVVQLALGSIASSGGYVHNVGGDKFNNHIIHPKTGLSNRAVISSTVIADDAITADTTATILMNMTPKEAVAYMDDFNLSGLVFCPQGKSFLSERALKSFGLFSK
jgi:thiamine biosynthesis lipoprotein